MRIVVLGAGVQGTLFGVRLARAGYSVSVVARGQRAVELQRHGAVIEHALTRQRETARLPVLAQIDPSLEADLCLVTVRREQLDNVLPALNAARGITRFLFMVNHANGSEALLAAVGRHRVILGFPGAAGAVEDGIVRYIEVAEQPTAIEATAPDIAARLHGAGFCVSLVQDMNSWLQRHAVFITAIAGALYKAGTDANRLSQDGGLVRDVVLAVREGWSGMDNRRIAPAPLALRAIFQWAPLPVSVMYWRRFFASPKAEYYFARHTRHATKEMAALAADIRGLLRGEAMPHLAELFSQIDRAADAL